MRILAVLLFLGFSTSFSQTKYQQLDLDSKSFDEFSVFGDTLKNYRVFFTGENHLYASFNTLLEFKLLKYLNQTQGVKNLVFEQSPAVGYILNKVVVDGKQSHENYLQDMFYEPFFDFVLELKAYNDTLPDEDKIRVHGIDAERFPYFSIYALNSIVDTLTTRFEGGQIFEQIKALASANYDDFNVGTYYDEPDFRFDFEFTQVSPWSSLKSIIDDSNNSKDTLMKYLGADGPIYFAIIKSLETGREWYLSEKAGDIKSPIIRERFMCDEFERIYRKDLTAKFYGQFGRCHLHKDKGARSCYDYYMNSVANRISEVDRSLEKAVLVIPIFYSKTKEMDGDEIDLLELDEQFLEDETSWLIDLAYKNGNHTITGFYDQLPFVIICNEEADGLEDSYFTWQTPLEEGHAGAYYGYRYFTKIRNLNSAIENFGSVGFTDKFTTYTYSVDYFQMGIGGGRVGLTFMPEVSNFDGFTMRGYLISFGQYIPFGNRYLVAAFGSDWSFGRMSLSEASDNTQPNLIQQGGQNIIIYRNDILLWDPNVELRLTLPIISFNLKAGYSFDISGKYWKLDGKMKEFTKTSFTSPYIQAGISLNFKTGG